MSLSFQSNLTNVACKYLQRLNVPFTKSSLQKNLEEHPFYPSLYSLNQVFNQLGMDNEAFEVSEDKFDEFEPPFIAYYNEESKGKDFVLVTAVTPVEVCYISSGNKPVTVPRKQFMSGFQNVVFAAESGNESGEKDYEKTLLSEKKQHRKKTLQYAALFVLGAVVFAQFFYTLNGWLVPAIIVSLTKLLGIGVTLLLVAYEAGQKNNIVKNICTGSKQFNCDAVINSKGSKIFGIAWGDFGFVYFAATTLFLLFPGIAFAEKLPWLAITSTLAAPYIFYSLYYQWKVVKQWCPLCLMVQAVLLAECGWSIAYYWIPGNLTVGTDAFLLMALAVSVLLPASGWFMLRPVITKAKSSGLYQAAYKRLLYHPETIRSQIAQQDAALEGWEHLGIDLGDASATDVILKVCNPYCGPCSRAHAVLEEIVQRNKNVKVKVIFTSNETDRGAPVVKHLMALYSKNDPEQTTCALDDWYLADKKDYENFAARYPLNGELKEQDAKISEMSKWCKKAGIHYTPTIYVNGRRLPENYDASSLKNIF